MTDEIDFLCHSKHSESSMDPPRHGVCALVAARKWTHNAGLLIIINSEFKSFGLPPIPKLDNTRIKISVKLISHVFVYSYDSNDELKKILNRAHGKEDDMTLDE